MKPQGHQEELLSAYLDDELSAAEALEVERLLSEQSELGGVREGWESLRSGLRSLPRHTAPADLADRVLAEIRAGQEPGGPHVTGATAGDQVAARSQVVQNAASTSAWTTWTVATAVAAIAAVLVLALVANRPPRADGLDRSHLVQDDPRQQPVIQDAGPVALARPKYYLVFDVTLTRQGRQRQAFEEMLVAHGIKLCESLTVKKPLENALLSGRFLEPPRAEDRGKEVQLVYVYAAAWQIDRLDRVLRNNPQDVARVKMDLTVTQNRSRIFDQLRRASFAELAAVEPGEHGYAQPLDWSVPQSSPTGVGMANGLLGMLSRLGYRQLPIVGELPDVSAPQVQPTAFVRGEIDMPAEALFVIRYVK